MKRTLLTLAFAAACQWSPQALAAASCSFNSAAGATLVDFSANNSTAYLSGQTANLDAMGTLGITCTGIPALTTLSYTVTIGTGSSGSFINRRLVMGGFGLTYNLYTDTTRTMIWGTGPVSGTSQVSGLCVVSPCLISLPVFGRVVGGQSVPAGNYSDSVVVTINF